MKKKFIFFLLCFTLLVFVGCRSERTDATLTPTVPPTATTAPTETPTPTPTPANAAMETLEQWEENLITALNWNGTADFDFSQGVGYDITLNLSVNKLLLSLSGMADLSDIAITMNMDMNEELLYSDISLSVSNNNFFDYEMLFADDKLWMNVPKYSSQYALTESAAEGTMTGFDVSQYEKLIALFQNFVSDSLDAIQPVEGYTDNASFEIDGYQVTGRKFSVYVTLSEFNAVLHEFSDTFQELFPDAETGVTEFPTDSYNLLIVDYYVNEDGAYAWVCYPNTTPNDLFGLISTEKGFCLFTDYYETTDKLFYTEKTSSTEGTLYLPGTESTLELNYTLGENSISLYEPSLDMAISARWSFSDDTVSYEVTLATTDVSVTYSMAAAGKTAHMELILSSYDTRLGILTADYTLRECNKITLPENYLDAASWYEQFDTEAFRADIESMAETSPGLSDFLIGFYEGFTHTDITPDTEEELDTSSDITYDNTFSNLTGYWVDEYGNVDFLAQESEVLALGLSSTGIYSIPISGDQRQALINYGATVLDNPYSESITFYEILGNIYSSVQSYFYTEYYTEDAGNYYNQIDLYTEAVTGNFCMVGVSNVSKEKAFVMANDILSILGETYYLDINLDAETLEMGIWVGDYHVYGWDNDNYFLIWIYSE